VNEELLPTPPGYETSAGMARIGWLAAQLDDQLRLLGRRLEGAGVELLEWQPQPGANTIGMLLAHNAITEAYWVHIAEGRVRSFAEADAADGRKLVGQLVDDDVRKVALRARRVRDLEHEHGRRVGIRLDDLRFLQRRIVGQRRAYASDLLLHVDRSYVDVRAESELHAHGRETLVRIRLENVDAGNAADRFLDGPRYGRLDRFR